MEDSRAFEMVDSVQEESFAYLLVVTSNALLDSFSIVYCRHHRSGDGIDLLMVLQDSNIRTTFPPEQSEGFSLGADKSPPFM